ncbi:hypothetical protein Q7P37_008424 [Cladosporium fusiforme]
MNHWKVSSTLANRAEHRTIKDATKALQVHFSAAKPVPSLPTEARRMLQHFTDQHDEQLSDEDSSRANQELKIFWERHVADNPQKLGAFAGVLKELRPAITAEADLWDWWRRCVKPVISAVGFRKQALDDAQEFLIGAMVEHDEEVGNETSSDLSSRLCGELFGIYIARTCEVYDEDVLVAPENAQIAQQVEGVLIAFGKKKTKDFFINVDDLIKSASCRLQALNLLSNFLRSQAPHTYTAMDTPLVESILKCLMNDTSTTVLSVALTCLVMLLPHIPGPVGVHLPRLCLVYSRLLCWERFSPLSTEAQRDLVTDDRIDMDSEDEGSPENIGIDPTWEVLRPDADVVETTVPELLSYFTYLYALYPLNFMSYIRKPRKYLKSLNFPGADDFDLDQAVIRSRTDQYRDVHLMHSNFYNLTPEEELVDPKWAKLEPADVVAECNTLYSNRKILLASPGPPPTGKLPDLPPFPPLSVQTGPSHPSGSTQISPVASQASLRSGVSWRETNLAHPSQHAEVESPQMSDDEGGAEQLRIPSKSSAMSKGASLNVEDFPEPGNGGSVRASKDKSEAPQTNLAYLQREITLLRNDLNFERWHKAQYSQHIGQLSRKNVKDATAEAETLNLINANRALKKQLEHIRNAREATLKDSALTRKQANNMESHMLDRLRSMKKEQETWMAESGELKRLRAETKQFRDLLVACEARELNKSHELELLQRDMGKLQHAQEQLRDANRRMREYEYQEFEFERAKRETEILQNEKQTLQMKLTRREQDSERLKHALTSRIAELEAQMDSSPDFSTRSNAQPTQDTHMMIQRAVGESQAKLTQLKKAHSRLLEKYTDLELEYQSVKSQLDAIHGGDGTGQTFFNDGEGNFSDQHGSDSGALTAADSGYDTYSDYQHPSSDPTGRRFQPPPNTVRSPGAGSLPTAQRTEPTMHVGTGLTWKPPASRGESMHSGVQTPTVTFNQTSPLVSEDLKGSSKSGFSDASSEMSQGKKNKLVPATSEVRYYGRGGAQNIKLKSKKDKADGDDGSSDKAKGKGGFRGFRGFM